LNLKSSSKRTRKTQSVSILPLFSWREALVQPGTRAGRFVTRRYRVHPALADLIADLAGLGSEARS
jgi:chorismate-pyruvate lyase